MGRKISGLKFAHKLIIGQVAVVLMLVSIMVITWRNIEGNFTFIETECV